jgi:hypothetical protein
LISELASLLTEFSPQAAKNVSDKRTAETFENNLEFAFVFMIIIYSRNMKMRSLKRTYHRVPAL